MKTFYEITRDRFEGCLLGGAAGDALGYAIEFWSETSIFGTFGPDGIRTLHQAADATRSSVAHFSDDTQMTLFTANGLTHGMERNDGVPEASDIWLAYREWLATQGDPSRMDDPAHPKMWLSGRASLHALRAPGNTCLSAIRESPNGGELRSPVNGSKGCGGVMRVAPIGLLGSVSSRVDGMRLAAEAAALTHGHPLGWLSAAALAEIVSRLCTCNLEGDESPESALAATIGAAADAVARRFSGWSEAAELRDLMLYALRLARGRTRSADNDLVRIHRLGEGWVGEEALAIAIYAVMAHADDAAEALRCAVNHRGDSDSTGAVAGNIIGALIGRKALEQALDLTLLEEKDLIVQVADSLLDTADVSMRKLVDDPGLLLAIPRPPSPDNEARRAWLLEDTGMPYTPMTKKALELSFQAHVNQRDKSGLPYVYHPFHLADQMRTEETACVALLHDVVEDGHFTLEELSREGMSDAVVRSVANMTHKKGIPYMDYVMGLRQDPVARVVKLADLRHNANLSRLDEPTPADRHRRVRYLIAQALLDDGADLYDDTVEPPVWRKRIPLDDEDKHTLMLTYTDAGRAVGFRIEADGRRYTFSAGQAPAIRYALDKSRSLPEGLADAISQGGMLAVTSILDEQGVPYQVL